MGVCHKRVKVWIEYKYKI